MYARRHPDVSRFLATRGLWLVLLELTLLRVAWTFNVEFGGYNMAGVIWVIGWCMVVLALLARLPLAAIGAFGVVIIAGHNVVRSHPRARLDAERKQSVGPVENPLSRILCRADRPRERWSSVVGAVFTRAVGRRDRGWLRVRGCADARAGTTPAHLPRDRARFNRRVRGPARVESVWRSAAVAIGPRRPERDEVSGVAVLPADDPRPDDRGDASARQRAAVLSRGGSRSSAACPSSTTCCTSH